MMSFLRRKWNRLKLLLKGERFLCDTCKYDWGNVCVRRERPNARVCPDYKRR